MEKKGVKKMNEKILIADDSLFARKVLIDILSKNGYKNIVEAKDGVEAVEKYESEKPDLVLLDLIMAKMDGVEALQKIMELDKNAKVVVVSAVGQETIVSKSLKIGAKEYVVKPVDEHRLMNAIKKAVG